jgi:hypothetical protein
MHGSESGVLKRVLTITNDQAKQYNSEPEEVRHSKLSKEKVI